MTEEELQEQLDILIWDSIDKSKEPRAAILAAFAELRAERDAARTAIMLILDCVDYTDHACQPNEPIGGVLPTQILNKVKRALVVKP